MKRPERIPQDVWEKLTVNVAAEAGLLGSVPAEWLIVGGNALLCDAGDDSLVASMLAENISVEAAKKACVIVRIRERRKEKSEESFGPLEHARLIASVFGGTDGRTSGIRGARADRVEIDEHVVFDRATVERAAMRGTKCKKHVCGTLDGNVYCVKCGATEAQIIDDMADEEDDMARRFDVHAGVMNRHDARALLRKCISRECEPSCGPVSASDLLQAVLKEIEASEKPEGT